MNKNKQLFKQQRLIRSFVVALLLIITLGLGIGGLQLLNTEPEVWPDVTASLSVVRNTAIGMLLLCVCFALSTAWVLKGHAMATKATLVSLLLFVIGGFIANYLLFGHWRWAHTATNVLLAIVIVALLLRLPAQTSS